MKIRRTIRKQVMAGDSNAIRDLLLTVAQIKLVKWVAANDVSTAAQLAQRLGVSIQNASSKLNRLYRAGYLERLTTSAESGGIEFVYRAQEYGS